MCVTTLPPGGRADINTEHFLVWMHQVRNVLANKMMNPLREGFTPLQPPTYVFFGQVQKKRDVSGNATECFQCANVHGVNICIIHQLTILSDVFLYNCTISDECI